MLFISRARPSFCFARLKQRSERWVDSFPIAACLLRSAMSEHMLDENRSRMTYRIPSPNYPKAKQGDSIFSVIFKDRQSAFSDRHSNCRSFYVFIFFEIH
jgi:hypothetical protein